MSVGIFQTKKRCFLEQVFHGKFPFSFFGNLGGKCDKFFLGKEKHGQLFFLLSCQMVPLIKELFLKARLNDFKIFLH